MSNDSATPRNVIVLSIVIGLAVVGLETIVNRASDGTLLYTLTFWTMLAQGVVALAATGELTKGLWLRPIRRELLSLYPMLFFMAFLYLLMGSRMDIYSWTSHPTVWLNARFFIVRNFVVMLMTAWTAHLLARAVMSGNPKKNTYAVFYIALFIISESLIAFDWIMSLEYPWISTLFGGHFFVQSIMMGLIFSVFVVFFRTRAGVTGLTETLRDSAKMIFGFCFLWGGFLFAQYLTIWYANIPEEVSFILKRVDPAPYWGLSRVSLALIFAVPFVTLLSRKIKVLPIGMAMVGLSVTLGLFLEKLILITPVVPINPIVLAGETVLMLVLVAGLFRGRDSFMPKAVTTAGGGAAGHGESGDLATAHHR